MLRLYVVGCGGIGGYLTDMLPMACTSIGLDFLEKNKRNISQYLRDAGNCILPSLVESIILIDGDTFDPRNAIRQGAGAGNKLAQRLFAINNSMVRQTYLRHVIIDGFPYYITPTNVEQMIPLKSPGNQENREQFNALPNSWEFGRYTLWEKDFPVIFICVDNVKTRYELSKYAEQHPNILVINGGNEKTTGHVTIYERRDNKALDPNLYELFDNVKPNVDKRPDEVSCTTVAPKHDQVAITNAMVANVMLEFFTHWATHATLDDFVVKGKQCRRNEVVLDVEKLSMTAITHQLAPQPTEGGNK